MRVCNGGHAEGTRLLLAGRRARISRTTKAIRRWVVSRAMSPNFGWEVTLADALCMRASTAISPCTTPYWKGATPNSLNIFESQAIQRDVGLLDLILGKS